jgi:hypothetical protein
VLNVVGGYDGIGDPVLGEGGNRQNVPRGI